jgi:hypothetical protein
MLAIYLIFAAIALIAFACTSRVRRSRRIIITLLVFLVPSLGVTAWIVAVGDRAPPDAVTVHL